jgi:hypothetical protein
MAMLFPDNGLAGVSALGWATGKATGLTPAPLQLALANHERLNF